MKTKAATDNKAIPVTPQTKLATSHAVLTLPPPATPCAVASPPRHVRQVLRLRQRHLRLSSFKKRRRIRRLRHSRCVLVGEAMIRRPEISAGRLYGQDEEEYQHCGGAGMVKAHLEIFVLFLE